MGTESRSSQENILGRDAQGSAPPSSLRPALTEYGPHLRELARRPGPRAGLWGPHTFILRSTPVHTCLRLACRFHLAALLPHHYRRDGRGAEGGCRPLHAEQSGQGPPGLFLHTPKYQATFPSLSPFHLQGDRFCCYFLIQHAAQMLPFPQHPVSPPTLTSHRHLQSARRALAACSGRFFHPECLPSLSQSHIPRSGLP